MPFLTHLLIALLISASSLAATEPPKLSAAEQQIVDASKTRTEAARNRDVAAWSHFVADDCLFSDDDGILYTKAQMMETYRKLPRDYDRSVDQRDFIVHLYGNTAVANSRGT